MEIMILFKSCGSKGGRIFPSRSSHSAAGGKDNGLVTATVTPRLGVWSSETHREERVGGQRCGGGG